MWRCEFCRCVNPNINGSSANLMSLLHQIRGRAIILANVQYYPDGGERIGNVEAAIEQLQAGQQELLAGQQELQAGRGYLAERCLAR